MEQLFHLLNSIKELSPGLQDFLFSKLKAEDVKKSEIILKPGQVCRRICFIEKGLFRCYYIKEGKEVCTWFMSESDVIVSVTSFFKQQPSYEFIQALEDTSLYYITHDELNAAYNQFPEFNFIGRELLTKYYLLSEERLFCLRNSTGIQKIEFLFTHYPNLVERVEQQHLASYLNIRAEYYSQCKWAYLEMRAKKKPNT